MNHEVNVIEDWLRQPAHSLDVTLRLRVAGATTAQERQELTEQLQRTLAIVVAGNQPTRAKVIRSALLRLNRQASREQDGSQEDHR